MRIAFYAPLKSPDHPVPSGDRQMARQIMAALKAGGHDVRLASQLRAHASDPDPEKLKKFNRDAAQETARVLEECSGAGAWRPELWLTYHNYYKAPDLIGPEVAQGLAIPYCGMESSFARKRRSDEWADWTAAAEFGMRRARLNFFMTDVDRQGLAELVGEDRLAAMPPFIDASGFGRANVAEGGPVRFVAVAMMRARGKLDSYKLIAEALALCGDFDWSLEIVGDGPERSAVEALFAPFGSRITFTGELDRHGVAQAYARSDVLLWPGFSEAYGLVYLEAQAAGLPVIALDRGPQHAVIRAEETGLLTTADAAAFAQAVRALSSNAGLRMRMGDAAAEFVQSERTIEVAAERFDAAFREIAPADSVPLRPAVFPKTAALLDQAANAGRKISIWLRDDDAVAPTYQLERLLETVCGRGLALTLAVIPQYATHALAGRLQGIALANVATHGLAHINHAPAGTKSSEFGASRAAREAALDLQSGHERMQALFGGKALALFVPPWNRMDESLHGMLAEHGYRAISTFGEKGETAKAGLVPVSTHLDIMDWKTREGRAADALDAELALLMKQRLEGDNDMPLGILTHHLVHDETAWSAVEGLVALLANHPAVEWLDMRAYLAEHSQ